jgi:protein tyrosine phosphatase
MDQEYRILQRLTCHKLKYDSLFKPFDPEFVNRNRHQSIFPFDYNRVVLEKPWKNASDRPKEKDAEDSAAIVVEEFNGYQDVDFKNGSNEDINTVL